MVLAIFFGLLVMLIAYGTSLLGDTIIKIATSVLGAFGGPIFGAFLLGMFIPWTSSTVRFFKFPFLPIHLTEFIVLGLSYRNRCWSGF